MSNAFVLFNSKTSEALVEETQTQRPEILEVQPDEPMESLHLIFLKIRRPCKNVAKFNHYRSTKLCCQKKEEYSEVKNDTINFAKNPKF